MSTVTTGKNGEDLACEYLKKQGYAVIERNFRIKGGEIDIIAKDGQYLIFVEVKTRYSHEYGLPVESITLRKIQYLLRTARYYIFETGWGNDPFRLDFVSVDFADNPDIPEISLIKNITEF